MTIISKRFLLACLCALPSVLFAAENAPEPQPVTPALTATAAPPEPAQQPAKNIQAPRIGYVDFIRIANESERGKALKILLTAKKDKLQVKIDGKTKQIEKLKASIEAKIATMTPAQREAKSKEFQKKMEEFQKLAQTSEEELRTLQDKESRALYEAVEQAATAHGAANGFAAIVVKKELLYLGTPVDVQDVTGTLIAALNQTAQKK